MAERPICTASNPALPHPEQRPGYHSRWNWNFDHPDAVEYCIDDDHEDYEYVCPHCRQRRIEEGIDS